MAAPTSLRTTPLNAVHRALNARMVDFGGWDMPVQYTGIIDEHHAVRRAAGLFDVSHMGEIDIRGPQAAQLVDSVTTNSVARLQTGQIQYSALLYETGGFVDDILVHKVAPDHYFLCVNASYHDERGPFRFVTAPRRRPRHPGPRLTNARAPCILCTRAHGGGPSVRLVGSA